MKKIKLKLISPTTQKLAVVKLIKECSELGLKDSKDILDKVCAGSVEEFYIRKPENGINFGDKFRKEIAKLDGIFSVSGGLESQREKKLLELGMGNTQDYSNFIIENIFFTEADMKIALDLILSKLSKSDLIDVFNKINEKLWT